MTADSIISAEAAPTIEPRCRLISARQLRVYLGVDGATISRMRKAGSLPNPVPGTRKYDFEAVKRALDPDRVSDATIADSEAALIGRARQWGKSP